MSQDGSSDKRGALISSLRETAALHDDVSVCDLLCKAADALADDGKCHCGQKSCVYPTCGWRPSHVADTQLGETPRADAYAETSLLPDWTGLECSPEQREHIIKALRGWYELARQLERELAEANGAISHLHRKNAEALDQLVAARSSRAATHEELPIVKTLRDRAALLTKDSFDPFAARKDTVEWAAAAVIERLQAACERHSEADLLGETERCELQKLRALSAIAAPKDQTGWLVENGKQGGELRYRTMNDLGFSTWTADSNEALRFCRRVDAEKFAAQDEDAWAIVEHRWCAEDGYPQERVDAVTRACASALHSRKEEK